MMIVWMLTKNTKKKKKISNKMELLWLVTVSYTHLTLPTKA